MSDGEKRPYADATKVAELVVKTLRSCCTRVEIAGSLRRKKPMVSDIEIVLIPNMYTGIFGDPLPSAYSVELAISEHQWAIVKNGNWYKQIKVAGFSVDLFITTPEKWGCIFAIRTGSAVFSHRLMTPKRYGGLCPSNLKFREGRLWDGDTALDTPEEIDVFNALGLAYIEPELRLA